MSGSAPHIPGCRDLALIGERVARSLFSAVSDRTGGAVTVTVFPPLGDGRTMDGFERAAATAQRLGAHPSVVTIHEWGLAPDNRPWIVTEPQPAESVDTLLTMDGPLSVERALQVGILLAGALETAHRSGIIHGDLSPARLVFGAQGEPLLAETGLAEYAVFPGLGALNNPVRYHAPPEVLERTDIGPETDVYSLATIVYALLAGRAPQQKPAEITDSNASLLLRILQMAVPPIERPDLPPGLGDALRGPLSPNPESRPQQVIDLAWLLQDVQRRAGYAITQPVVLDLDDLDAGDRSLRAPATTAPTFGLTHGQDAGPAPAEPWAPTDAPSESAWAGPGPPAEAPWTAPPPATFAPADDPWPRTDAPAARSTPAPWEPAEAADEVSPWAPDTTARPPSPWAPAEGSSGDRSPWAPSDDAPPGSSPWAAATSARPSSPERAPVAPHPDAEIEPPAPPPTIFPFAEGVDDDAGHGTHERASSEPAQDVPDAPLWSASPSADDAAKGSLWPSSWPADQDVTETPAWAAPPPDDPAPARPAAGAQADDLARSPLADPDDRPDAGVGSDGGSIGDVAGLPGTNGSDPPAPSAAAGFGSPGRPPELDELPAWYTDPLPNDPPAAANGRPPDTSAGTPFSPAVGNGFGNGNGNGRTDDTWAGSGPDATSWSVPPSAASAAAGEELPGSGDDLRSLFGEVVGDPGAPTPDPPRQHRADPESHDRGPADADPLGPAGDRPPIDLSRLDAPLGPSPYLPPAARPDADTSTPWSHQRAPHRPPDGAQPPANRLPRRHEVPGWQDDADTSGAAPPRLPRAAEHDGGSTTPERAPRLERAVPRQVVGGNDAPTSRAASAGPPAMPVIVLVAVVVILLLGVVWLVVTGSGDDASPATTDTTTTTTTAADEPVETATPAAPGEVAVTTVPEGFQITWAGLADGNYVVTVLSADQPPRPLPATVGASALVTSVDAGPGGHCFIVSNASPAGEATGPASAPACTPDTAPDAMQAG